MGVNYLVKNIKIIINPFFLNALVAILLKGVLKILKKERSVVLNVRLLKEDWKRENDRLLNVLNVAKK